MALVDMAAWRAERGMNSPDPSRRPGEPSRADLVGYIRRLEAAIIERDRVIAQLQAAVTSLQPPPRPAVRAQVIRKNRR